jgi:hypothetical protein
MQGTPAWFANGVCLCLLYIHCSWCVWWVSVHIVSHNTAKPSCDCACLPKHYKYIQDWLETQPGFLIVCPWCKQGPTHCALLWFSNTFLCYIWHEPDLLVTFTFEVFNLITRLAYLWNSYTCLCWAASSFVMSYLCAIARHDVSVVQAHVATGLVRADPRQSI